MSVLKFYLNEGFFRNANIERFAGNVMASAELLALTMGVSKAKTEIYKRVLLNAELTTNVDELLNINNTKNKYTNELVRNNVFFRTQGGITIELIDVETHVTLNNTIVSTPLNKRKGSVKEFIQAQDYNIEISGQLISDKQNAFPLQEFKDLIEILEETEQIEISNVYVNTFGVCRVVLKSYTFDKSTKFVNTVSFKLSLLSDEDYNLIIEDEC
jgi:hypothetical protein